MLPKYKYLLTYRYAEVVFDLTAEFCQRFLRGDLGGIPLRRTVEQMVQVFDSEGQSPQAQTRRAARSGKQNIVEGVSQQTSLKSQIKLLGVAAASFEELIADFEDFLRQRKLPIWDKNDPRVQEFRRFGIEATRPKLPKLLKLLKNSTEAANLLLTLCHQETYLLSRQIASLEKKFITEGGYTEKLFQKRLAYCSRKSFTRRSLDEGGPR